MVPCSCFPVASQWYSGSADRGSGSLGLANSFEIPVGWYWAMGKTCSQTVWRNPTFIALPRSVALWILLRVMCPHRTTVCCLQDCLVLCFCLRPAAGELSFESMEDGQAGGTPLTLGKGRWMEGSKRIATAEKRSPSIVCSLCDDPGTRCRQLQWEEPPSQSKRSHTLLALFLSDVDEEINEKN